MHASEIRSRFLAYFERQGHAVRPSSSLVPGDDPTLLFTNAGMVQFKKVFLGLEEPPGGVRRATTSQKCVRAGGKHNDLEQVGHTARHHTFFEMLGNFSFGDYFKRDAIRFAWDFVTADLGIDPKHLRVTVYRTDDEARSLWKEIAGLPDSRIYGLGERDNFWQMADTGPCGPCTEIYVDLAAVAKDWAFPADASGEWTETNREDFSLDAFVEGAEAGRFLEIWNLVFMQYDRQSDGELRPLPKPSVDTGAGLERIAAVLEGVTNNYHTSLFAPLIASVERAVGIEYWGRRGSEVRRGVRARGRGGDMRTIANALDPASFRVLADHARSVAFLLADGVFPSNEGRGYVLRRILRRAVRHAWLLGRTEPTLHEIVATVVETMGAAFPELRARERHILDTTRAEEERFLATIEGGLTRFEQLAPANSTQGSVEVRGTISGEDAFRLYDTFGFPIDLTELMARERGYTVDIAGFESALASQRSQSKEERKTRKLGVGGEELGSLSQFELAASGTPVESRFVGYDVVAATTEIVALKRLEGDRVAVVLRDTPFYAESGGQVSDRGEIVGEGWRVEVDDVRKVEGRTVAIGKATGEVRSRGQVVARVPSDRRRDTERNHTATHLLHAALRRVLGEHVHQAGSLVAPDRLRFDFTHHGPVKGEQLAEIEELVNREVWSGEPVQTTEMPYAEAIAAGAMALFGEKYGDVVRVVSIPDFSRELCGGTHVRNTSEIGLFKVLSESGVAAGVRRIEAATARGAYEVLREREGALLRVAEVVRAPVDGVVKKVQGLVDERRALEKRIDEAMKGGGGAGGGQQLQALVSRAVAVNGTRVLAANVEAADARTLQALGDAVREAIESGVAALAATFEDGKHGLLVVVTDDLRERGVRADAVIREVAALAGGRGGGKPHMAQAGLPDASRIPAALDGVLGIVRSMLDRAA
ncbi:MAG TPA: alanine--tRNA ligase [Gemmatimonadaceae bacterium]|nr:alanine--tRNA ligase [Gemmatimonadaceae bacterium]